MLLQVGLYFDHVALVTYDSSARIQFDLVERTSLEELRRGINAIPILHGETNTPDGLQLGLQVSRRPASCLPVFGRGVNFIWGWGYKFQVIPISKSTTICPGSKRIKNNQ